MREGFTNGLRRIATEHECQIKWGGAPAGVNFRCYMCGHKFQPGDGWRWQYCAGKTTVEHDGQRFGLMNFMVCDDCDGTDVIDRWVAKHVEFYSDKFWALR
jgi:hypothetical protein